MDADITVDAVRAGKIGNEGEAGFNTCQLVTYRGGKREVWTDIETENLVSLIAANKSTLFNPYTPRKKKRELWEAVARVIHLKNPWSHQKSMKSVQKKWNNLHSICKKEIDNYKRADGQPIQVKPITLKIYNEIFNGKEDFCLPGNLNEGSEESLYGGISDEERVIREELQQSPRSSNFFYVECESPLLTSISVDEAESETSDNLKDPLMITKDQKHNSCTEAPTRRESLGNELLANRLELIQLQIECQRTSNRMRSIQLMEQMLKCVRQQIEYEESLSRPVREELHQMRRLINAKLMAVLKEDL